MQKLYPVKVTVTTHYPLLQQKRVYGFQIPVEQVEHKHAEVQRC